MPNKIKYGVCLPIMLAVPLFLWLMPLSWLAIEGTTVVQQRMIAIFAFAALSWVFEVIPNWVTSVLVIVIMLFTVSSQGLAFLVSPDVGQLVNYKAIIASFADPVIMLFLGGFVLAIVAGKYGIDAVIARNLMKVFGTRPKFVLLGFLLTVSTFSMFMSDTATSAMFFAFLAPVLKSLPDSEKGRIGLTLAIPFAALTGGMGTPIGTPPNAIAVGALANASIQIHFGQWMLHMIPYVIIMILIIWGILQLFYPCQVKELKFEIPVKNTKPTVRTYIAWITFFVTIILWVTESWTGLNSNVVALVPVAIYALTGIFTKEDLKSIDWAVLWLVAGGFALGTGLEQTGLADLMISAIPFDSMNIVRIALIAGFVCYGLSNFISNSATAALIIPIMMVVCKVVGGQTEMIPYIAICASLAMTLPISTPSNAIATSTGMVTTKQMAQVGLIIGIIGFVLGYFWLTVIFPF